MQTARQRSVRIELPVLYPKQRAAIYSPARFAVIEGSTKCGKTMGCLTWLLEQALTGPPGEYWWVAPVYAQTKIAFRRMSKMVPLQFLKSSPNKSELYLELLTGQVIRFRTGKDPDNLYGEDVQAAVFDEASRAKEESWTALRSTLTATQGQARLIGNVRGKSWHYRLGLKGRQSEPGYSYHKLTAWDAVEAGVIPSEEVTQAARDLPSRAFRQLYFCIPADDAHNPFGSDAIERCVAPLSSARPFVWGVDLARKVDFTVLLALDRGGHACHLDSIRDVPWSEVMDRIVQTCRNPGLIDATGVGDPIAEDVRRSGAPLEPFVFTSRSRQQILEELRLAIAREHVRFPRSVAEQLDLFEYSYSVTGGVRYAAPEGVHDDEVMALALAWHRGRQMGIGSEPGEVVAPRRRSRSAGVRQYFD